MKAGFHARIPRLPATVSTDNDVQKTQENRLLRLLNSVSVPQQCCVRDEGRPLAIGLQEQVANHRKRLGSKALTVSVTKKASRRI
ncbi:hypothetical protein CR163_011085 [Prosthecochloris sp. ZM_2]|nr:hypothetical protein CR163_011085 [Prosthecochloris sp. ZM_2]